MLEPSYHLEAVVKSRDEREDFTGPLDVILMLLAKNKIEIRDIQISSLLEQYLAYLDGMKEMDLDIASEFVQMASHLMYIKTRMLLAGEEEVTELEVLVNALEQLQNRDILAAVKEQTPELDRRARAGLRLHTREPSPLPGRPYEYSHSPAEIFRAISGVLLRGEASRPDEIPLALAVPRPIVYGLRQKTGQLTALLRERRHMELRELYALCASRSELVATFLAVLELCAAGEMHIENNDGDYTISRSAPQE